MRFITATLGVLGLVVSSVHATGCWWGESVGFYPEGQGHLINMCQVRTCRIEEYVES
jgi:hypothetical protein